MGIRYFLGRSGSGKSYRMMEEIVEDHKNGGGAPLILLVPEQFTLQAERDLIEKMNLPGLMRIEVLSFTRLAYRIFNEVGGLTRITISEQGKNMVLRKIINENLDELTIYKKAAGQSGMVDKISSTLRMLKQQSISPEDFRQVGSSLTDESTILKINDIAMIYQKFNEYLEGRYLDTEDRVNLFMDKMEQSSYLRQAHIWIDGFITYSSQSLNIIEKLICLAKKTTISFTINNDDDPDSDLFYLSAQSYRKVRTMARQYGIREEIIQFTSEKHKHGKQPELEFLEKEIYSYPYRLYGGKVKNIRFFASTNIQSEVENAARAVITLAREKAYRWKDIAIVCNNMDTYGDIIARTFTQYGIPYFMDSKRTIITNPLIQLILSALKVLEHNFKSEDMFRLMKTGLNNIPAAACEQLENYALQYGLNGAGWRKPLVRGEEKLRTELETYREALAAPLDKFRQKTRGKMTCIRINQALYEFLSELRIEAKLEDWITKLDAEGQYALASANTQTWNIVVDILEQMDEFLGDNEMNRQEYGRVLEAGFITYEIGLIPTTIDQVLIGDIQRSKSHDIKALLLLGANDGVLPSARQEEELLSVQEKELIQGQGLDMGYSREKQALEERFLIYHALSKPSDGLFLSWSLADREGKAMRPSILIDRMLKLFPGIKIKSDISNTDSDWEQIAAPHSTFTHLISSMRNILDHKTVPDYWWDVYNWYYEKHEWQERREMVIKGIIHTNQLTYIESKTAVKLYGGTLYPSVSRLEKFAACPFAHFIRYGLTPRERKMYTVEWPDMGEMLHKSLFLFADSLHCSGLQWNTLGHTECDTIMDGVMDNIIEEYGDGVLASTYRYRYLGRRLKRIGRRAAWTLTEHLQKGDFTPAEFEVRFGRGGKFPPVLVELEDGQKMFLEGRIDRVDFWDADDATYARIIDYKTGDKKLDLSDVYFGLSLQLLVYLQAVLAAQKNEQHPLKPGGIFYFKIDDPILNTDQITADVEKALARELRMRGVVLKDVSIAQHMDHDIGNSDVIPVALTRSGEFTKYSSVLAESEFMALLQHVTELIQAMGTEILKGRVAIEPVNKDGKTACSYCSYWSVCQFDRLLHDNNYRNLRSPSYEEIITRVSKEAKNHGCMD